MTESKRKRLQTIKKMKRFYKRCKKSLRHYLIETTETTETTKDLTGRRFKFNRIRK